MTTVSATVSAPGVPNVQLSASYTVTTAPAPTKPAIPDGVYPMGWASVQATRPPLKDYEGDWDFAKMGLDLSGWQIHGAVNFRLPNIVGDGFKVVGAPAGTSGNALLDFNTNFTGTPPNLKHFTVAPDVSVMGVNGWMGCEATLFDFDIWGTSDGLSPNNLHNTSGPLNLKADWGFVHDLVYWRNDPSHPDGSHNDGCQIPGGKGATITRVYFTGLSHPTRGDGVLLRKTGPGTTSLPGPRPGGQVNSSVMITQNVAAVDVAFDQCRFGGGWYSTINMTAGKLTVTNSVFDGNSFYGLDMVANTGATLVQSGNRRVDGKPLKVKLNN